MSQELTVGAQVRLLVDIGAKLPKGSVGVLYRIDHEEYPNDIQGDQFSYSVVFVSLGNKFESRQPDVPNLLVTSVPHHNSVAVRRREFEIV